VAVRALADRLERHQVAVYLAALGAGVLIGLVAPDAAGLFEAMIYPVLGALLYATFLQVPFTALRAAFGDRRFLLGFDVWRAAASALPARSRSRHRSNDEQADSSRSHATKPNLWLTQVRRDQSRFAPAGP
jgi:hypothetical protein